MREVAVTARGKGCKVGLEEHRQKGRDQREAELVINAYKTGRSANEIPNFLGLSEARVAFTIAEYERANRP